MSYTLGLMRVVQGSKPFVLIDGEKMSLDSKRDMIYANRALLMNREWPETIRIFDSPPRGIFSERITKIDYGDCAIDITWPHDLVISWRNDSIDDIRSIIDIRMERIGRRINRLETRRFTLFGVHVEVGPAFGCGVLYPKLSARGRVYDNIVDCIDRFRWPPDSDRMFDGRHPDSPFAPMPEVIGRPDNYDGFVSECERREEIINAVDYRSCSTRINGHVVEYDGPGGTLKIDGDVKPLYVDGVFNPSISEILVGYTPVDGNDGIFARDEGIFRTLESVPVKFKTSVVLSGLVTPSRIISLIEKRTYEFLFWYGGGAW